MVFILNLKRHNVSHYIYYHTDNIHIVLENVFRVNKGLKRL